MKTLKKLVFFFFYFINYFVNSFQISTQLKEYTSQDNTMYSLYNEKNLVELEDKPVYLHDWGKYFVSKFNLTKSGQNNTQIDEVKNSELSNKDLLIDDQPNYFYLNKAFLNLGNLKSKKDNKDDFFKKDSIGYVNIPSENSFFFILSRKNINILSSRRADTAKTIDLINFSDIEVKNDSNNNIYMGINDLGVFNEGHCLQILTIKKLSYTICFETQVSKNNWIVTISKLIYKSYYFRSQAIENKSNLNKSISSTSQLLVNSINMTLSKTSYDDNTNYDGNPLNVMPNPVLPKNVTTTIISTIKEIKELNFNPTKNWVAIKAWSQCSRLCGGGKSILERVCLDFNTGNNKISSTNIIDNCKGEAILIKDCNLNPCSDQNYNIFNKSFGGVLNQPTTSSVLTSKIFNSLDGTSNAIYDKNVKPIFKFVPISKQYDRYERCVIKSGNLALYIDSGGIKGAKIPSRVIMTNTTISIYSSDDFNSLLVSHSLGTITDLKKLQTDDTCFQILETSKSSILCAFVSNSKSLSALAKEWFEDILYFIKNCSKYYSIQNKVVKFKGKIIINIVVNNNIYIYLILDNENSESSALDYYTKKQETEIDKIISRTQTLAVSALEKELKVESIIEKEEDSKDKDLETQMLKELEKTQKQKDLIEKKMEVKRKEAVLFSKKLELRKKIKEIKDQVQEQINKIRKELKSRLLRKRKDEQRKKDLFMQKINEIKVEISKKLLKASKQGDSDYCNPERESKLIIDYCNKNFNDVSKQAECVKYDNYCYLCCENEFGDLHLDDRADCNSKCDDLYNNSDKNKNMKLDVKNPETLNISKQEVKLNKKITADKNPIINYNNNKIADQHRIINKLSKSKKSHEKLNETILIQKIERAKKNEILKNIKETLLG
jgi:hypothetical protein